MGYESYLRKRRKSIGMYEYSFTDFSLVYRSAFAQIFSKVTVHERIQHLNIIPM
jgi:hypothetical protein